MYALMLLFWNYTWYAICAAISLSYALFDRVSKIHLPCITNGVELDSGTFRSWCRSLAVTDRKCVCSNLAFEQHKCNSSVNVEILLYITVSTLKTLNAACVPTCSNTKTVATELLNLILLLNVFSKCWLSKNTKSVMSLGLNSDWNSINCFEFEVVLSGMIVSSDIITLTLINPFNLLKVINVH